MRDKERQYVHDLAYGLRDTKEFWAEFDKALNRYAKAVMLELIIEADATNNGEFSSWEVDNYVLKLRQRVEKL